jgi:hypothetical protein
MATKVRMNEVTMKNYLEELLAMKNYLAMKNCVEVRLCRRIQGGGFAPP